MSDTPQKTGDRAQKSLGSVVRRGALLALVSQGIVASLSLLTFAYLARVVNTSKYGEYLLAILILTCVQWLSSNAYKEPIVQAPSIDDNALSSSYWFATLVGAVLGTVLLTTAYILYRLGKSTDLAICVGGLSLKILADSNAAVCLGLLGRQLAFGKIASITAGSSIVSSITILTLLHLHVGIPSMVAGQAFGSVLIATGSLIASGWRPQWRFRLADLTAYRSYSPHVISWQGVDALNNGFDRFFVAGSLSVAALGIYGFARRLNDVVLEILVNAIAGVTLPAFSAVQQDKRRLQDAFIRAVRFATFLVLPVVALLVVCGPDLIVAVFGDKWLPALPVYRCFVLVGFLQIVGAFQSTLIRSTGHPHLWARYIAFQAAGNVVAVLLFVHYGIVVLAAALVSKTYLIWGWSVLITCRVLAMKIRTYLAVLIRPLGCAVLSALGVFLLLRYFPIANVWLRLVSAVGAGAGLYLALSLLINRAAMFELWRFALKA